MRLKFLVSLLVLVLIIGFYIWQTKVNWSTILDILEKLSVIISGISIAFVIATYIYNRSKDKTIKAIEQISFLRKEIIPENDKFVNEVRAKRGEDYVFSRIKLDIPEIAFIRDTYQKEVKNQLNVLIELKTFSRQTSILNMLEEFSTAVIHHDIVRHEVLDSSKSAFTELVEVNALVLLHQSKIITGGPLYASIIELYKAWKDQVDRRSPKERMEEIQSKFIN